MHTRFALYMQDKHPMQYELEMVRYAEARGFSEIWQADTRLARDCIVMMSAFLANTQRLRFGSGVLPIWTRNPAVIAATWSTMWELGGQVDGHGRVMLGLGAWWEPIAGRVGVTREKPLKAMREYIESIRQLFSMQEVTYQGDFVHLDKIRLDVAYGDASPRDIPIYLRCHRRQDARDGRRDLRRSCTQLCRLGGLYQTRGCFGEKGRHESREKSERSGPSRVARLLPVGQGSQSGHGGREETGGLLPGYRAAHHESQRGERGSARESPVHIDLAGHRKRLHSRL